MRVDRFKIRWIIALVALLATAAIMAGCGGGGGGGGGTSGGGTFAYSGVVEDTSSNPLVGDTVAFNGNAAYSSVTTSPSGAFNITGVPASAITGADSLTVTDASGLPIATYNLPAGPKGAKGLVIKTGPPPPPF